MRTYVRTYVRTDGRGRLPNFLGLMDFPFSMGMELRPRAPSAPAGAPLIKKWGSPDSFFSYKHLKGKLRVFLTGKTVAIVTSDVMKMTTTY